MPGLSPKGVCSPQATSVASSLAQLPCQLSVAEEVSRMLTPLRRIQNNLNPAPLIRAGC